VPEWKYGTVVKSLAGRDKGQFFIAVGQDGDRLLLCDGKERPLERPKRKSFRHAAATRTVLEPSDMTGNHAIRKKLNRLGTCCEKEAAATNDHMEREERNPCQNKI
jgi:ribosomal protein L14E/L6E/L27E